MISVLGRRMGKLHGHSGRPSSRAPGFETAKKQRNRKRINWPIYLLYPHLRDSSQELAAGGVSSLSATTQGLAAWYRSDLLSQTGKALAELLMLAMADQAQKSRAFGRFGHLHGQKRRHCWTHREGNRSSPWSLKFPGEAGEPGWAPGPASGHVQTGLCLVVTNLHRSQFSGRQPWKKEGDNTLSIRQTSGC